MQVERTQEQTKYLEMYGKATALEQTAHGLLSEEALWHLRQAVSSIQEATEEKATTAEAYRITVEVAVPVRTDPERGTRPPETALASLQDAMERFEERNEVLDWRLIPYAPQGEDGPNNVVRARLETDIDGYVVEGSAFREPDDAGGLKAEVLGELEEWASEAEDISQEIEKSGGGEEESSAYGSRSERIGELMGRVRAARVVEYPPPIPPGGDKAGAA